MSATSDDGSGSYDSFQDARDAGGGMIRRWARASSRALKGTEHFLNDMHDAYTFDLDPEYRLKLVKR